MRGPWIHLCIDMQRIFGEETPWHVPCSLAGGSARPDSDVDLMVVADFDLFELGEVAERLEAVLGRRIDLNLHTPGEWSSLANDHVIKEIMLGKRLLLLESPKG